MTTGKLEARFRAWLAEAYPRERGVPPVTQLRQLEAAFYVGAISAMDSAVSRAEVLQDVKAHLTRVANVNRNRSDPPTDD